MVRFLRLKIRNATDTAFEYDNYTDESWGITAGTASLESAIMQDELEFGQCNSAMFQIQIFGIDADLSGRRIEVWLSETKPVYSHIISDEGDNIISDAGDFLSSLDGEATETKILFTGWIDSCKKDQSGIYRDIIAYDWVFYHREDNVADWWNNVWDNIDSVELYNFRNGLLRTRGPSSIMPTGSFDNDHMMLYKDTVFRPTSLTFEALMNMICVLQNTCYCCDEWGNSKLVTLDTTVKNIGNNVEGENSEWEDYTTNQITGVAVYDTSDNLAQLVGTNGNVYKIVGNLLLLNQSAEDITTYCTTILNTLSQIQYVPCELKLIESDLSYELGDKISTTHGNSYIFKKVLSGSLLIDETLIATAFNANLNTDVRSTNNELIEGYKISKLEQNIDGIEAEVTNLASGMSTLISVSAGKIVLKATDGSSTTQVTIGSLNTVGQTSVFQVSADNIDFISNGLIQLTAKDIGINSTDFSVTKAGAITATRGVLGGWTFNDSMIFKEITTGSGLNQITYRPMINAPANPTDANVAFAIRKQVGGDDPTYPFRVNYSGRVIALDGNIAGWEFDDTKFYKEVTISGVTYRPMLNAPASPTTSSIAFGIVRTENGTTTQPFRVNYDGSMSATNANLLGGKIAGWNITSDDINYTNSSNDYIVFANGSNANKDVLVVRTGTTGSYKYPFWLNANGVIHAESGDIAGWELSEDTMTSTNGNDRAFLRKPYANGAASDWIFAVQHKNSSTQNWDAYWYVNGNGAMYVGSTARLIGGVIIGSGASGNVPGISFRYNNTTSDYTLRLRQTTTGTLDVIEDPSTWGKVRALSFDVQSSIKVKRNIRNIADSEAKKILSLRPVSFDYINGVKNNRGLIAEEVMEILPNMVDVPEEYDPDKAEDLMNVPSIDYSKFVPYLIKMIQIQQKQIDKLLDKCYNK